MSVQILGLVSAAPMIVNDWAISVEPIEGGHRLIARRGTEEQTIDIMNGQNGMDGQNGAKGDKGDTGPIGPIGPQGIPGTTGAKGEKGDRGPAGPQGAPFTYNDFTPEQLAQLQGPPGATGPQGERGEKGDAFKYSDFTAAQLAALKGPQGETGPVGPAGPQGETGAQGPAGYTPVRGKDYWTEEDQEAITEEVSNQLSLEIADELAKRGQLKPEFANSIEECTDTSLLYVLPDGYIYGYMHREWLSFTNALESAVDENDVPFNDGKGYDTGYRFNSDGVLVELAGSAYTGFIPYDGKSAIRIFGATQDTTQQYIYLYDSTKTRISGDSGFSLQDMIGTYGGTLTQETVGSYTSYLITYDIDAIAAVKDWVANSFRKAAYIRFNVKIPNTECFWVSIGEEMSVDNGYAWWNTGHAFVPADYEDRIISLENAKTDLNERVTALESIDIAGVPDYVKTEAENVIDKVIEAQGSRTFTFAAVSDLHYENGNYTNGILHMSQALNYIGSRIKLDAFAVLGDYVSSYPSSDYTDSMDDFQDVNHLLNEMRFAPNLRVQGNHDFVEAKSPVVYRYVQSFSDDVVWGDRLGGYCYRDFTDYKLRVIALNMMEANNGNGGVWSANQMNWLIQSLDLSGKSDAAQWQILLISHHPLDWYYADYTSGDNVTVVIPYILEAYRNGEAWSHNRLNVSCNFSGKNVAKLIGNIHGHIHNYMVDYLYLNNSSGVKSSVKRIATPEACIGRANNSYVGSIWEDSETYEKNVNTVEDTAFCVYCIDMDTSTIKAVHYGAGVDREIAY